MHGYNNYITNGVQYMSKNGVKSLKEYLVSVSERQSTIFGSPTDFTMPVMHSVQTESAF